MGRALRVILVATVFCVAPRAGAQGLAGFDEFLRQYIDADVRGQARVLASFVEQQQTRGGFPIREGSGQVVFVYVSDGSQRDVRLVGDFRARSLTNPYWDMVGQPLSRVGAVFYLRQTFEPDARLDDRFVVDGKPTLDPLNTDDLQRHRRGERIGARDARAPDRPGDSRP